MRNIVIMISGKSNNGKGAVADLIISESSDDWNKIQSSLSTYIRDIAINDFFWDGIDTDESREFMQEVYRLGSKLYPYHMSRRVWERDNFPYLEPTDNLIVVESLREKCNYDYYVGLIDKNLIDKVLTVRVERPNFTALSDNKLKQHISETDMDDFDFDFTIYNDGDEFNYEDRLKEQVQDFLERFSL